MFNNPIFTWNEELKEAACIITDSRTGIIYKGKATCHPDDYDMASEKTGCEIASRRAVIKALQGYKKELNIKLSTLNNLYYNMKHSTHFNPKSYENKMLQRHIQMIKNDLATTKEMLVEEQESLREYLKIKEKLYTTLRHMRKNYPKVAKAKNN